MNTPAHSFHAPLNTILGWQATLLSNEIDNDDLVADLESLITLHFLEWTSLQTDEPKIHRLQALKSTGVWGQGEQDEALYLQQRADQRIRLVEEAQRIYEQIALRYG